MALDMRGLTFRESLHTRFVLGLGAVLLPFLVAMGIGYAYLLPALVSSLDNIVRVFAEQQAPAMQLQTALLQAAMPVNDYLINGQEDEQELFARLRQKVDRAFQAVQQAHSTPDDVHLELTSAREQWGLALRLGEKILRVPDPIGNADAAQEMKRFDAHIDEAVISLEEVQHHFRQVIDASRAQAIRTRMATLWASFAVFGAAIAVSLFAALALARSVTNPVDVLQRGVKQLAAGKLSHRIDFQRHDELGELAAAFNAMASALEKNQAELTELATLDGLTGLYNHRTFYVLLRGELARAQRFNRPVSLLLLDIDHFKSVNDTYGHQAGDAVLKDLGALLGREAREIDRICRYGGEEITIILPETDIDAAAGIAERLRASVQAHTFAAGNGASLHLTVSIGAASWPLHASNIQGLVSEADAAMYAAKQAGRNRVVRYDPALDAQAP